MKKIPTLIAALENVSDDRVIEAVSFAIRIDILTHSVLGVVIVGTLLYFAYKVIKRVYMS